MAYKMNAIEIERIEEIRHRLRVVRDHWRLTVERGGSPIAWRIPRDDAVNRAEAIELALPRRGTRPDAV